MSVSTSMSQSMNTDQPSYPERYGVRKRENEKSVLCRECRSRVKTPFSCESIKGVIETGCEARAWILCASTLNATVSRGS